MRLWTLTPLNDLDINCRTRPFLAGALSSRYFNMLNNAMTSTLNPPMSLLDHSFLPTGDPETRGKLENYAQLYTTYTRLIQCQGDAMRQDTLAMKDAYDKVATEFAAEQNIFAKKTLGTSDILADLNEYARRCSVTPQSFEE